MFFFQFMLQILTKTSWKNCVSKKEFNVVLWYFLDFFYSLKTISCSLKPENILRHKLLYASTSMEKTLKYKLSQIVLKTQFQSKNKTFVKIVKSFKSWILDKDDISHIWEIFWVVLCDFWVQFVSSNLDWKSDKKWVEKNSLNQPIKFQNRILKPFIGDSL